MTTGVKAAAIAAALMVALTAAPAAFALPGNGNSLAENQGTTQNNVSGGDDQNTTAGNGNGNARARGDALN